MFKTYKTRLLEQISDQLAAILKEQRMTRQSTTDLANAVSALALSVTNATTTIKAEVDKLAAAATDGDDAAVEASVATLKTLTSQLDDAVSAANAAVNPTDAPVDGTATPPADQQPGTGSVDPNAPVS
jgi:hypothetical protein